MRSNLPICVDSLDSERFWRCRFERRPERAVTWVGDGCRGSRRGCVKMENAGQSLGLWAPERAATPIAPVQSLW